MHCSGWYPERSNQCAISVLWKVSPPPKEVIGFEIRNVANLKEIGHPLELNKNNNCFYYKEISYLDKIFRKFIYGIPLKPCLEKLTK